VVAYGITQFCKLVVEGILINSDNFNLFGEIVRMVIAISDIFAIWFLLKRRTPLMFGVGWALSDSLVKKLIPLTLGARGEFHYRYILMGIDSNISLVYFILLSSIINLLIPHKNVANSATNSDFAKNVYFAIFISLLLQPTLSFLSYKQKDEFLWIVKSLFVVALWMTSKILSNSDSKLH